MEESNAKRRAKSLIRRFRRRAERVRHLRKRITRHGQHLPAQFLQGAAQQLGSSAVSLLILWWETRH